jgi:hypothetical protein
MTRTAVILMGVLATGGGLVRAPDPAPGRGDASGVEGAGRLEIRTTDEGVEVRDGGGLVLFYQRALRDHDGQYARSNYVHPLMSLDGDVLTEDFPPDHLHQRGIFWAWHQLWSGDERLGDGWMVEDFITEVGQVETSVTGGGARLVALVSWRSPRFRGRGPFVEERTSITVHPVVEGARAVDFEIALRAAAPGIRIGGSEDEKGYGGFSVRARMPDGLTFTGEAGPVEPEELQVAAGPWVDLSGPYGTDGAVSGISILTHPSSPGFPPPWILREKGSMQNPVFPGREPVDIPADRPVVLRYRVVVHRGPATVDQVSRWQAIYASS